jgi:hypothetical protein
MIEMSKSDIYTEDCPVCGGENKAVIKEIGRYLRRVVNTYCVCDRYGKGGKLDWITLSKSGENQLMPSRVFDTLKATQVRGILGFSNIELDLSDQGINLDRTFCFAIASTDPFNAVYDKAVNLKQAKALINRCESVEEQFQKLNLSKCNNFIYKLKLAYHEWAQELES